MLVSYQRPNTIEEALTLLAQPNTIPLGGGTVINTPAFTASYGSDFAVVDLQALGLNQIHKKGNTLEIGAAAPLQALLEDEHTPLALQDVIRLEAPVNIRNMATVAGALVACDGRSPFATAMLALDVRFSWVCVQKSETIQLGDFLPRHERLQCLITLVSLPLNVHFAFETVARTPADRPIVCAALARWPSGRTRLALGGYGKAPSFAMDGSEAEGLETPALRAAARNAFHEAGDAWATAEYRADVAAVLAERCLKKLPPTS